MNVHLTFTRNAFDNVILDENRFDCTWDEFYESLLDGVTYSDNKEYNVMIHPTRFKTYDDDYEPAYKDLEKTQLKFLDDGRKALCRCGENMVAQYCLPIDIDGEISITTAKKMFAKFSYIAHTSFSHGSPAKEGKDCFRLFIQLSTPMPVEDYGSRRWAMKKWMGPRICDQSTFAKSRGFFAPMCPESRKQHLQIWRNDGIPLDWTLFPKEEPYKAPTTEHEPLADAAKQKLLEDIKSIYLGEYPLWLNMASALKGGGYSLDDFIYATIGGMMSAKTPSDCAKMWNSCGSYSIGYAITFVRNRKQLRA